MSKISTNINSILIRLNFDTCLVIASESTCCEECPYRASSKMTIQNANKLKVQLHKRLHKMVAQLLAGDDLLMTSPIDVHSVD